MNLIDAWKSAKEGQQIKRKNSGPLNLSLKIDRLHSIRYASIHLLDEHDLLADDWEVMKEKKEKVYNLSLSGHLIYDDKNKSCGAVIEIPAGAKVTIEWEE